MINKKFTNNESGNVITIQNDDGIWFTLTNGSKIKKDSFFNKYTEVIDPNNFFNSNTNNIESIANKLKNIDTTNVVTDNTQGPIVKKVNTYESNIETDENLKQKIISDYIQKQKQKDIELSKYKQVDDDETAANQLLSNNPNFPELDPNVKRDRKTNDDYYRQQYTANESNTNLPPYQQKPMTDEEAAELESFKFFKGFKKNHTVTINLIINEKIADPEFLKLMLNNFEADVIKFYTKEIFNEFINNPESIENLIYEQLREIIIGKKRKSRKKTTKKEINTDNDTKTDNVEKEEKIENEDHK